MNKTVQATSMQVRAKTEEGLLINEVSTYSDTNWDNEATANQTASNPVLLYPASTNSGTTWYHGASTKANDAAGATGANAKSANLINNNYSELTGLTSITAFEAAAQGGTNAAREAMGTAADADAGYYVHYTYYLKSSSDAVTLNTTENAMNVYIKSVTATPNGGASGDLNKSLRVGILMKASGTFYIYAPVEGYTSEYWVGAGATKTKPISGNTATATDLTTLPSVGTDGTPVEVYLWYEGEDQNCKSVNATAATLDNINVDIEFELKAVPST
jgi:DNA uptake protein ComE-like DNA-binding protein